MKILVIDDIQENLELAKLQLAGHELTLVSTVGEAISALTHSGNFLRGQGNLDEEKFKRLMTERGVREDKKALDALALECREALFDMVLSDMLMPAGDPYELLGDKGRAYATEMMPVGFALGLLAVKHGAKYVGVVSNTGHHDHPCGLWLDFFLDSSMSSYTRTREWFMINGAKMGFFGGWKKDWANAVKELLET